jgi:hypothetical protein
MKYMQTIRLAGLCLVAVFAVSLVASATASAATWEQCAEGAAGTKYETNQCSKLLSTGKWGWQELKTTEKIQGQATLYLADTEGGLFGELAEVECTGHEFGTIGPKEYDKVTSVTTVTCRNITGCPGPSAEPRNLPWQTKLREEAGGEKRDEITSGINETGKEAGWKVSCTGLSDTCEKNGATAAATNLPAEGAVQIQFDAKTENAVCSRTKKPTGRVRGEVKVRSEEGYAIRVQ